MSALAARFAEQACFDAFVNCYVQELGLGEWHAAREWRRRVDPDWSGRGAFVLELAAVGARPRLAFDVLYRSAVGRHCFGAVRSEFRDSFREADSLHTVLALIGELYRASGGTGKLGRAHELELLLRYVQSQQHMTRYLLARSDRALDSDRFIDAEQSLLYGHWRHPTPKSRQGMTEWQHDSFAPELRGRFQLHYFAVARALIRQQSALAHDTEHLLNDLLVGDAAAERHLSRAQERGEVLVPVHPLQVDWLLRQPHVERWLSDGSLRQVGCLGRTFTATSSVRTVYSEDSDFMLKLSIPVKITNSLRVNRRSELPAGVSMARLLCTLGAPVGLSAIADPAYLTVEAPSDIESGFELVLRENPFRRGRDSGVCCVAALVQAPLPHRASRLSRLLEGLALTEGRDLTAVALDWLARYLSCAIEPLVRLYDEHGIALEAHQQNSLLDVLAGYPRASYFRDSQGYYLSNQHRARLVALEPELLLRPELFFDDQVILERFSYYLFSNQLFAVVQRLGADGSLDEGTALALVKSRLRSLSTQLSGQGRRLLHAVLEQPRLPYKANLLTRVADLDELATEHEPAVYVTVDNPLQHPGPAAEELEVA